MSFQLPMSKIKALRATIAAHNLICTPEYDRLSDEQLQTVANGIGPDAFPGFVHEACDEVFERYLPASVPHDVGYEFAGAVSGGGTRTHWHKLNDDFRENCHRLMIAGTHWRQIFRRAGERAIIDGLFAAVESDAGWKSYMAAHDRGPGVTLS